jgi:DNA-directed RNA polymerase subunit RPC12/RpoP
MNKVTNHALCAKCGYDLFGMDADEDMHLVCPECGSKLVPAHPDTLFTTKKLHMTYLYHMVLPPLMCSALSVMSIMVLNFNFIIIGGYFLIMPVVIFVSLLITSISVYKQLKRYPRPCPRWGAWLWGFIYLLPSVAMYLFVFYLANNIL